MLYPNIEPIDANMPKFTRLKVRPCHITTGIRSANSVLINFPGVPVTAALSCKNGFRRFTSADASFISFGLFLPTVVFYLFIMTIGAQYFPFYFYRAISWEEWNKGHSVLFHPLPEQAQLLVHSCIDKYLNLFRLL
jgi:hypothetical protein